MAEIYLSECTGFTIGGIHSSSFEDLYLERVSRPLLATKLYYVEKIPNSDKTFSLENGFEEKAVTISLLIDTDDATQRKINSDSVINWIYSYSEVIFDDEPSKIYKYRMKDGVSVEEFTTADRITVVLTCEPLQYSTLNTVSKTGIVGNSSIDVTNSGSYKSFPIIKIMGTASSITFTNDSGSFTVSNVSQTTYVDCEKFLCYTMSGDTKVNNFTNFSGNVISLPSGSSSISVTGSGLNVNVDVIFKYIYR